MKDSESKICVHWNRSSSSTTSKGTEVLDNLSIQNKTLHVLDDTRTILKQNFKNTNGVAVSSPCLFDVGTTIPVEEIKRKLAESDLKEHIDSTQEEKREHIIGIGDIESRISQDFEGSKYTFPIDGDFPVFDRSEICKGRCLGRGGFSDVHEIPEIHCRRESMKSSLHSQNQETTKGTTRKSFTVKNIISSITRSRSETTNNTFKQRSSVAKQLSKFNHEDFYYGDDSDCPDNTESRLFIAKHCIRHNGDVRYAIKQLRSDVDEDSEKYLVGISDLIVETRILYHLEHPHIIKLRGIANVNPYKKGYFLVLDRLYDTLGTRLQTWKKQEKKYKSIIRRHFTAGKRKELLKTRLMAAYDLSAAVAYLHEKRICHRDIKPDNIGFDLRGDIKLFDFGMARDLSMLTGDCDGMFLLTQMCGSLRYMAPEVALGQPYNQGCDVYSFSILLYQMLALKRPNDGYNTTEEFFHGIFIEGKRPVIPKKWQSSWREILESGWNTDPTMRLDMQMLKDRLYKELDDQVDYDVRKSFNRRKSTFVYRPTKPTKTKGTHLSIKAF